MEDFARQILSEAVRLAAAVSPWYALAVLLAAAVLLVVGSRVRLENQGPQEPADEDDMPNPGATLPTDPRRAEGDDGMGGG
jgi:hypothetical protein